MATFISTEVINSEAYKQAWLKGQPGNLVLRTVRAPPAAHSGSSVQEGSWGWAFSFPAWDKEEGI